jgi:hypothetical protein
MKITARQRGQRWRQKVAHAPVTVRRSGRPRGSKTELSALGRIRETYLYLYKHGSPKEAEAIVEAELGRPAMEWLVAFWKANGQLGPINSGNKFKSQSVL